MNLPERDPVVIACAADDAYVRPLAVMLQSVLENLGPDRTAAIYMLDGGIRPENRERLMSSWGRGRAVGHWLPVQASRFSGLPLWGRMPVSTYYKLLVPELLPAEVRRAIWLDCDLVVLGDLARLWEIETCGRHLMAVQDEVVPFVSSRDGVAGYRQLGLARDAKYFNAGVMLMDLARWREDRIPERVVEHLRLHRDRVVFWDQEGLNAVLGGRWGELDPRWNCNASVRRGRFRRRPTSTLADPSGDPWILHFTGNLKPWVYHGRDPSQGHYFHYLDRTAWGGWRPAPTVRGAMIGLYESSGLRGMLYPAEAWGMHLLRGLTRRYAPSGAS